MGSVMDQIRPKYREIAIAALGVENLRTQDPRAEELRFGRKAGSLVLNIKKGIWNDFNGGAGAHGGILDLIEYGLGTDRTGAIRWLRERGFIERQASAGSDYWRKRYARKKVIEKAMQVQAKACTVTTATATEGTESENRRETSINPAKVIEALMRTAQVREHEYMSSKHLTPTLTVTRDDLSAAGIRYLRTGDGYLDLDRPLIVCPMYRFDDQGLPRLATAELIDYKGAKATLPGRGHKIGAWCPASPFLDRAWAIPVPEEKPVIIITEGRADSETIRLALNTDEGTDYIVVAGMMATNLPAVAQEWRRVYRRSEILLVADLNKDGLPHPMAVRAAEVVGGRVVHTGTGIPQDDFSDLYLSAGGGEVGLQAVRIAFGQNKNISPLVMPDMVASTEAAESRVPNYE